MKSIALVEFGALPPVFFCRNGEGEEGIGPGDCFGDRGDLAALGSGRGAEFFEKLCFERFGPCVGGENLMLEAFELFGDEALGVDERLAPLKVLGDGLALAAAHLDIIAERFCVAHFERLDAGALAQLVLVGGHPGHASLAQRAEPVEFRVDLLAEEVSVADAERWVFLERAADPLRDGRDVGQVCLQRREKGERVADLGEAGQGAAKRPEVSRSGITGGSLGDEPFKVAHPFEEVAELLCRLGMGEELADAILPLFDQRDGEEGGLEPLAEEARAHRRRSVVNQVEEAVFRRAVALRFDEFKMAHRRAVDREEGGEGVVLKRGHMLEAKGEIFFQIGKESAGGGGCGGEAGQAEGVERGDAEVGEERLQGTLQIESPIVQLVDEEGKGVGEVLEKGRFTPLGDDEFGGAEAVEKVEEVLFFFQFEGAEFSRCEVEIGGAEDLSNEDEGGDVVVFLLLEELRLDEGARRDDPDDLALDEPFDRFGVFGLLGYGDLVAARDELVDILVGCVEGDAAHRDSLPLRQSEAEFF